MKATTIFNFIFKGKGSDNKELQDHFARLPLDCLMTVMKLTSPKDTCRSAAVNTTFQSVANSDDVWQSFLPDNLSSILDRAETDVEQLPVSKKELYLHLCHNWILLDGGTKSVRLDLLSGAKIIRLHNPSINDPIETPVNISEIIHFKDLSPNRNYAAYMIFTGRPRSRVLRITHAIHDRSSGWLSLFSMDICWQKSQTREDGWREIKLGDQFNTSVREHRKIYFIIDDRSIVDPRDDIDLVFVGIEVKPVC